MVKTDIMSSVLTKSTTRSEESRGIEWESNSVSKTIFPLFDEILKFGFLPKFIYIIALFIVTVQLISCSFWPEFRFIEDYEGIWGKILHYFMCVGFISDLSHEPVSYEILVIVYAVIVIFIIILIISQLVLYQTRLRFTRWALHVSRFTVEVIPYIVVIPLAHLVGMLFQDLINDYHGIYIFYLILSIIYYGFFILLKYAHSYFFALSPYLSNTSIATFDGCFDFFLIAGPSFFVLVSHIVQVLQTWVSAILVLGKIPYMVWIYYELFKFPYVHVISNYYVSWLVTSVLAEDFLSLMQIFGFRTVAMVKIIVFLVCAVISIAIIPVQYRIHKLKIKNLSYKSLDGIEVTDAVDNIYTKNQTAIFLKEKDKLQHYINLKIDKSKFSALGYLRIGLANHCDLFLDWSLIKFIAETHDDINTIECIIQALSFFPNESRLLRYFVGSFNEKSGLKFHDMFLMYQLSRLVGLRQSSASTSVIGKISEMRRYALKGFGSIQSFWIHVPDSIDYFYQVEHYMESGKALFNEALDNWPNNMKITEEYTDFLVDDCTDFVNATKMKYRSEILEQYHSFAIDYSFRSFLRVYNDYLLRNIIDLKGNLISAKDISKTESQLGSNSSAMINSSSFEIELEADQEEELSRQIFSMHRLRLAYQKSIDSRKSKISTIFKIWTAISTLILIAMLIYIYFTFNGMFSNMSNNMHRQYYLHQVRYGIEASFTCTNILMFHELGIFSNSFYEQIIHPRIGEDFNYNLKLSDNIFDEILRWEEYGVTYYSELFDNIRQLSITETNLLSYMRELFYQETNFSFFKEDARIVDTNQSLEDIFSGMIIRIRELLLLDDDGNYPSPSDWINNRRFFEVLGNLRYLSLGFEDLESTINREIYDDKNSNTKTKNITLLIVCVITIVLTAPFLIFFLVYYIFELKELISLMKTVDIKTREEAATPLRLLQGDTIGMSNDTLSRKTLSTKLFIFLIIFMLIINILIYYFICYYGETENNLFFELNAWLYQGIQRGSLLLEVINYLFYSLAINNNKINLNFSTYDNMNQLANESLTTLIKVHSNLMKGTENAGPCTGFNSDLDAIHLTIVCTDEPEEGSIHDDFRCTSLDKSISLFGSMADELIRTPITNSFEANSTLYYLFHIANSHMIEQMFECAQILTENATLTQEDFHRVLIIILICGIILSLLEFLILFYFIEKLDKGFKGALLLLRRLSPKVFTQNQELMDYLLDRKTKKQKSKMCASKLVIFMLKDSVLCLNINGTVEVINSSVTNTFGYKPEQLLGQSISILLQEDSYESIQSQMGLMRNGECPPTFETKAIAKTDDDQEVPVNATLIGIEENGSVKSFVIILRNEMELEKQRVEAEKAKAQSEKLLFQILPRDIVVRLDQGEKDISFVVPSASIIFADIVKWSEYSASLSPAQIMCTLSMIFDKFDEMTAKYELITKIKLIGDVYMAAGGLFTPDKPPQEHAQQVLQLGLDILGVIDEVNSQLESNLQIRIGVNTNGPLIAGILGIHKPTFDIIGDPINVASRLQSTCIPGTVQISQKTFELVSNMNFNIEPRGEIELKGKGKQMAYIVRPAFANTLIMSALSSID